ncbi:MAG: alpha/beta hydrolase [Xanthomonadales bacterium]|nr:alpha/beta hydrolase [Xanthomonadales bacterium]
MMIVNNNGIELAIEIIGEGKPLIFAHGLGGNRQFTLEQFSSLADRYQIIAYDQRGHGGSTPITDPALYDANTMAEDISVIMDSLGLEQVIVGGESMGAATALLFALKHPQRVNALLLTAPAFSDKANTEKPRLQLMGEELLKGDMQDFLQKSARRMRVDFNMPEDIIRKIAWLQSSHYPESLGTACMTVINWKIYSDAQVLEQLSMPCCILAWANDPLHPFELAQQMSVVIPDAELISINNLQDIFTDPACIGNLYSDFLNKP